MRYTVEMYFYRAMQFSACMSSVRLSVTLVIVIT